jgi:tetratricopeptide (TPR) repeat protein
VRAQLGSIDEARVSLLRAVDIAPQSSFARSIIGMLELESGNAEAALEHFRHAGDAFAQAGIAMAENQRGNAAAARAALDELTSKFAAGFAFQIAQVHARMGHTDEALTWLERAADNHDPGILRLRNDASVTPLRGHRRFTALLRRLDNPE